MKSALPVDVPLSTSLLPVGSFTMPRMARATVVLGVLGQDVELAADVDVAERRAGPGVPHERIFVDRAAGGVGVEAERTVVAVDARDDFHRQEQLGAIADAVAERADEASDVGEAGFAIGVHVVGAERLALRRQHLTGRDVPETGVAEERRRRRPRGVCRCRRRGLSASAPGRPRTLRQPASHMLRAPSCTTAVCLFVVTSTPPIVTSRKPRPHPTSRLEGSQRQENEDLAGTRRTTSGVWIRLVRRRSAVSGYTSGSTGFFFANSHAMPMLMM